jgi:hypothetical protein
LLQVIKTIPDIGTGESSLHANENFPIDALMPRPLPTHHPRNCRKFGLEHPSLSSLWNLQVLLMLDLQPL